LNSKKKKKRRGPHKSPGGVIGKGSPLVEEEKNMGKDQRR